MRGSCTRRLQRVPQAGQWRLIPVPRSTLAGWCRGIPLTPEQTAAIRSRTGSRKGIPRDTQRKRREEVERIREEARTEAARLVHDPLWLAGTCLYWAEGAKTQRQLLMANSDPAILRIFIAWTGRYLAADARFVLALHLHHGNDENAAKQHWLDVLHLDRADFTKTHIKAPGTGHRKNHLQHGICRIRLRRGADASVRVEGWIEYLAANLPGGSLAQLARATGS